MKKYHLFPFYKSLRFRFGMLFNILLLVFLSGIVFLVYNSVRKVLQQDFTNRLSLGANAILQKTSIDPLTIPIPQNDEYFLITYNNSHSVDTLFNTLPVEAAHPGSNKVSAARQWWSFRKERQLETGGTISIVYTLPAIEYNTAIRRMQTLLFLYIPIAVFLSFIMGYFLSGVFLKPLNRMIEKTNNIDLANDIQLLEEPAVKDELYELTDAINRMLTRIETQSHHQNAFFASASHELRTPLANMLTELQTLDRTEMPAEINQLILNQTNEVKRMKELVNHFLCMSQLKANSITTNFTNFDVTELIIEIIAASYTRSREKNMRIKLIAEPEDASFIANGDRNQWSIILSNLTANAVKYGSADSQISLEISVAGQFISTKIVNVTNEVIANPEILKNEFIRLKSFDDGFGLGLWIADQLVKRNNGFLNLSCRNNMFVAEILIPLAVF